MLVANWLRAACLAETICGLGFEMQSLPSVMGRPSMFVVDQVAWGKLALDDTTTWSPIHPIKCFTM